MFGQVDVGKEGRKTRSCQEKNVIYMDREMVGQETMDRQTDRGERGGEREAS